MTAASGLGRFVRPPGAAGTAQAQPGAAGAAQAQPGAALMAHREPAAGRPKPPAEACELCHAEIPAEHGHIADLGLSTLKCACRACYLLFTSSQAGGGRYRAVPDRYLSDPARPMSAAEWDELQIPVGLAFFLRDSRLGQVAGFYPSPAGVTECRLDLAAWDRLAAGHPLLSSMEADVEAALICRNGDQVEHFVVPVDACYELAGLMRLHWRGFDGGEEARRSIAEFLDRVRSRARPAGNGPAAGTGRTVGAEPGAGHPPGTRQTAGGA
jgi:hypothetical protein